MKTERSMSPYQMFISGTLANDARRQLLLEENIDPRHFGGKDGTLTAAVDEESQVICDPFRLPFVLTDSQQEQLAQCLAVMQFQNDFVVSQQYCSSFSTGMFNYCNYNNIQ